MAIQVAGELAHIEKVNIKNISSVRDPMEVLIKGLKPFVKSQSELPLIPFRIKLVFFIMIFSMLFY